MKYVLFKTYVTGHDILCPNEVSGQNEFLLHFCEGYLSKSSHTKCYRYIPSSVRDIKEFNCNGSPDIGKKSRKNCHFFFITRHAYHFHLGKYGSFKAINMTLAFQ